MNGFNKGAKATYWAVKAIMSLSTVTTYINVLLISTDQLAQLYGDSDFADVFVNIKSVN